MSEEATAFTVSGVGLGWAMVPRAGTERRFAEDENGIDRSNIGAIITAMNVSGTASLLHLSAMPELLRFGSAGLSEQFLVQEMSAEIAAVTVGKASEGRAVGQSARIAPGRVVWLNCCCRCVVRLSRIVSSKGHRDS